MKRILIIIALLAMVFGFAAFQCSSSELTSAKLYIQQENYDKAKEVLLQEVQNNPLSSEGNYLLGYLYGEEGDFAKMVEYYDASLAIENKFEKEISDSKMYHWANNFNKGVSAFNKAAETTSEDSTKMYFENAIENFENSIMLEPDSSGAYQNLALAYLNSGRPDDAVEPLKTLLDIKKSENTYVMLGQIYVNQGEALNSKGTAQDSALAIEKLDEAIKYLQEGRKLFPENSDILLYLSNAYIKSNKLDVAMDAFESGVKQEPENQYYRYNYGVLLLQANEFEEAEAQFKKAIEIDPDYTNAYYNIAATYVKWGTTLRDQAEAEETGSTEYLKKFEAALPYLEKYVELNPDDAAMWELLGKVYANLGMTEKSTEAFEKADEHR